MKTNFWIKQEHSWSRELNVKACLRNANPGYIGMEIVIINWYLNVIKTKVKVEFTSNFPSRPGASDEIITVVFPVDQTK